jgi:hypothetical protein
MSNSNSNEVASVTAKVTEDKEDFRVNVGKNSDFNGLDIGTTLRRFTLMRRMWKFTNEELGWVTAVFLRKATAKYLRSMINENHEWKDRVEFQNKLYDMEFIDMSIDILEELADKAPNTELMISIRENSHEDFYVFLIKKKDNRDRGYMKDLDPMRNREKNIA